ncbi:MAG: hypothetical protein BroJett011_56720 [Chloroflexota bacterium]|nr:MAG: hypothetical protein BroJett011_56720 [Chloroflexota bacterium]
MRHILTAVALFTLSSLWAAACQSALTADPAGRTLATVTRPAPDPLPQATPVADEKAYPQITAVLWAGEFLWTANESGLLTRWDVQSGSYRQYRLPGQPVIRALAADGAALYAGTERGDIWRLVDEAAPTRLVGEELNRISALVFDSTLADGSVNDRKRAPDGSVWLATTAGLSVSSDEAGESARLVEDLPDESAISLAIAGDNTVWVAGQSYIARLNPGQTWQLYRLADNPLLLNRFRFVVLDDEGWPWFIGRQGKIHFDGQSWIAYDADVRRMASFTPVQPLAQITPPPLDFPSPMQDYVAWLKTWPRPSADNGRGMHFLQTHQFDPIEAQRQVNRLKQLGMRWALVPYAGHDQLVRTAPIFQAAGITVVWRPFVRPDESYDSWTQDVEFLRSRGLAPYFQLYNEPSLAQEWDNDQPVSQQTYWRNLLPAIRQVYDAGGYVGLQFVNPDWLRQTLQTLKAEGLDDAFDRLFFVPHLYGLNHPPEYDQDINGVLGFRRFAEIFEAEIGFVPVMIAGEGGWRLGEAQDNRYPAINAELHRDYHLAVFDWFRTGTLSNGEALPDYFFAFCPWLISDPQDPAAWFDSAAGDRTLTIEAVTTLPAFNRKFSWEE